MYPLTLIVIIVIDFVMNKAIISPKPWRQVRRGQIWTLQKTSLYLVIPTLNPKKYGVEVGLRISQEKTSAMTVAHDQTLPSLTVGEQGIN